MSSATSGKPRILLVEDDSAIREFLRTSLWGAGYRLEETSTGFAALEAAQRTPPDLVILDLGLPDVDGQIVLKRLREWLKAPVIILSAQPRRTKSYSARSRRRRLPDETI